MRLTSALALLLALLAGPAGATTVLHVPLEELAAGTPLVVRAVVSEQKVSWSGDGLRILTRTRLRVVEVLKGKAAPELTVQQVGGTLDGMAMRIPGDAQFAAGEEVVLFLEPHPTDAGEFVLVAMNAAKFTVQESAEGPRVVRDLAGLAFARPGPDGVIRLSPESPESSLSLEELARIVRRASR